MSSCELDWTFRKWDEIVCVFETGDGPNFIEAEFLNHCRLFSALQGNLLDILRAADTKMQGVWTCTTPSPSW